MGQETKWFVENVNVILTNTTTNNATWMTKAMYCLESGLFFMVIIPRQHSLFDKY